MGRGYPCFRLLVWALPSSPPDFSGQRHQRPSKRAPRSGRRPSPSVPGTHRRPGAAPRLQALAAFPTSRARAPDERPPPRRRVRTGPIPTQARASATGGFEHRPTSRARSGEARWRRTEDLLTIRLAAARARSWRRWRRGNFCPAAGPFRPWDILERRRDLGVARGFVTSDATASESADIDSVERGDSCRTERSRFRSRKRALREQATSEWRAEEARALGPATERVTTCHGDHGRHGAGHVQRRVTAPGHGGHGAGHGIHGASHSDHGAESGQRVRNPRRRRPPGQRLSPSHSKA
jgi:hypothetical protein